MIQRQLLRSTREYSSSRCGSDPVDIDADPLTLLLIGDGEVQGPILELFVDDLEAARDELVANG